MMKSHITHLAVLPVLAHVQFGHTVDVPPRSHDRAAEVTLAREGDPCGFQSEDGAICRDGLCCTLEGKCGSGGYFCGPAGCLPSYSTGCDMQNDINSDLPGHHGSRRPSSSEKQKKRREAAPAGRTLSAREAEAEAMVNLTMESIGNPAYLDHLAGMPRPQVGSVPYGSVITSCTVPGTVALTFDDGPWLYTEALLDILEREGAHATFFVCGGNMDVPQIMGRGHDELLRRMVASGHQVGSHSWGHPDLATVTGETALDQILKNEQALVEAVGLVPTYFRPPYFSYKQETLDILGRMGYHVINSDVDTKDYTGDYEAAEQTFTEALDQADPSSHSMLVLAHDIKKDTVHEFAEWMIHQAQEYGYRLVTVGECMGDPESNWYRNPDDGEPWSGDRNPERPDDDEDDDDDDDDDGEDEDDDDEDEEDGEVEDDEGADEEELDETYDAGLRRSLKHRRFLAPNFPVPVFPSREPPGQRGNKDKTPGSASTGSPHTIHIHEGPDPVAARPTVHHNENGREAIENTPVSPSLLLALRSQPRGFGECSGTIKSTNSTVVGPTVTAATAAPTIRPSTAGCHRTSKSTMGIVLALAFSLLVFH